MQGFTEKSSKNTMKDQMELKAGRNLEALRMIILVTEIVILNASPSPPFNAQSARLY